MTEKDKDFLEGLAISAACHVLPARKVFREPIAYSYNGVILPKLPEWDREKYPYAFLTKLSSGNTYYLTIIQEYSFELSDLSNAVIIYPTTAMRFRSAIGKTSWTEVTGSTDGLTAIDNIIWANFDVLNADGTIRLTASEPIPVCE